MADNPLKWRKQRYLGRRELAQELRKEGLTFGQIGLLMGVSAPAAFWLVYPEKHAEAARKQLQKKQEKGL